MRRIKMKTVLFLTLLEIFLVATSAFEETCEFDRNMEEQCRMHNYKTVKPLLDYFRQVRKELENKEINENKLNELNSDLMEKYQSCQIKVDKFESEINSKHNFIVKLKGELADKSTNLENCELKFQNLNSSLIEKDEKIKRFSENIQNITEHQKTIELQLEQSKTKLIKKEKDNQICRAEVNTLNKTLLNTLIPLSCSPFGDSDVHPLNVSGIGFFDVLCDSQLAGPGWIVILQRVGGNESFDRDWATYRKGFGSYKSDFFLGLEKIHRITSLQRFELYIHLVSKTGKNFFARFDDFKISDEDSGYKLNLGEFSGTLEEKGMRHHDNMKFTTFDRDNDNHKFNCAERWRGGWWFDACYHCHLTGQYGFNTLYWWGSDPVRIQIAKMLIRPKEAMNN